jgi:hypothetical protein
VAALYSEILYALRPSVLLALLRFVGAVACKQSLILGEPAQGSVGSPPA